VDLVVRVVEVADDRGARVDVRPTILAVLSVGCGVVPSPPRVAVVGVVVQLFTDPTRQPTHGCRGLARQGSCICDIGRKRVDSPTSRMASS
jgi:hypothetical protein